MSLEDGAATLTEFTADICSKKISDSSVYAHASIYGVAYEIGASKFYKANQK